MTRLTDEGVQEMAVHEPGYPISHTDFRDLALDLLDARAEIARLGREVNMARYGQPDFSWSIHKEAMAELQAENARVRDALEDQADFLDQMHHARMTGLGRDPDKYTTELSAQRDKIRAALTQEPKSPVEGSAKDD
jgi:hypothetical protein